MPTRSSLISLVGVLIVMTMGLALFLRTLQLSWTTVLLLSGLTLLTVPMLVAAFLLGPGISQNRRVEAIRQRPILVFGGWAGIGIALWVFSAALLYYTTGGSFLVKLTGNAQHTAFFLGAAVASLGVRRTPGGRFCRRCGYEMSEAIAADPEAQRCPECGSPWKGLMGTVRGTRTYRWHWIAAGILLGFCIAVAPLARLKFPGLTGASLRVLPSSTLIQEVGAGKGFSADLAFDTLRARSLSPAQELRLARALIDKRGRGDYLDSSADDWLLTLESTGRLPPDLAARYLESHPQPATIPFHRQRLGLPPAP